MVAERMNVRSQKIASNVACFFIGICVASLVLSNSEPLYKPGVWVSKQSNGGQLAVISRNQSSSDVQRVVSEIDNKEPQLDAETVLLEVEPEYRDQCRKILLGEAASFSQAYQDWFLYHNFFKGIPYGQGFFLDIGANDPFHISNSLFFEKCLGWKGLCVEPNPMYHPLYRNRNCTLIPHCLYKEEVEMGFWWSPGAGEGGMLVAKDDPISNRTIQCKPLQQILREQGVKRVDFVSLDTEGAEMSILRCFPFHEWNIKTWIIETNKGNTYLDFHLLRAGYMKVMELLAPNFKHPSGGEQLDSLFVLNDKTYRTPAEAKLQGVADCSPDDAKFNYCYSGRGWPKYSNDELQEDDQVKDYCPNAGVRLSRKDFRLDRPA